MEAYDLDIENYELDDILTLFHLTPQFTKSELKAAHMMALQMHPDKSKLPSDYFIFFMKAYKLLCRIYYFRHRDGERRPVYDTELGKDERFILENLNVKADTDSRKFNKWFNEMFDKVKMPDEEQDSGYETWFRDTSDEVSVKKIAMSQFDSEFERRKKDCKALVINKDLSEMGATGGYDLMREQPTFYSSSIFSKLPYEDLKRAHTETVVPVTKEDYLNKPKFSNIESYRSYRDGQNIAPPSLEQSKQFLAEKSKNTAEGDIHRIYNILKQDEAIQDKNDKWWGYLKQLKNE